MHRQAIAYPVDAISVAILARSCEAAKASISEGIDREPSLRILRLINEVLPVSSGSGSFPV